METTHTERQPNLMLLKMSLPMWTNDVIELEIKELKAHIQELELADKDASYYKNKLSLLEQALKTRA